MTASLQVSELFVSADASIRHVVKTIDGGARGIALVVDHDQRLLGTITDGDVRRAILAGVDLDMSVEHLLARKSGPYREPITAPVGVSQATLLRLMKERVVRQVPLLDHEDRVVGLVTMDDLLPQETLPLQAVIMAGGEGIRLRPLTEQIPKPMLPVGDRPLLELTIERLQRAGIQRVNIITNYKSEQIIEHFGDGRQHGVELGYVSEDKPLGTAGGLGLLEASQETLLVINGDILTQVDFRTMLSYHREHAADLTVGVRHYSLQIPYGVLECEGAFVRQVHEKPAYTFFVNAGIYLIEPGIRAYVPAHIRLDMTDLIERLIGDGKRVVSFPVVEYWLDIGQQADYEQARSDVESGRLAR